MGVGRGNGIRSQPNKKKDFAVRFWAKVNMTHCKNGHEFNNENTLFVKNHRKKELKNWRQCRKCLCERAREYRADPVKMVAIRASRLKSAQKKKQERIDSNGKC